MLRTPDGAAVHGLDVDDADLTEALEMEAHGVRVHAEAVGEILGGQRAESTSRARGTPRTGSRRQVP